MTFTYISLDTSVVVRLLVQNPIDQYRAAAVFLERRLDEEIPVEVTDLVLAEAYFALAHHYGIRKGDALTMIRQFVQKSGMKFSPIAIAVVALPNLATANPGFVDRLIHGSSHAAGSTLVTFEKAAGKLPATLVLK